MSTTISTTIVCDGDDCINYIYGAGGHRPEKARARRRAREAGWVCRGGQDFCPDCVRKERNPLPTYYKTSANTIEVSGSRPVRQARSPHGHHTLARDRAEVEVNNRTAINLIKESIAHREASRTEDEEEENHQH